MSDFITRRKKQLETERERDQQQELNWINHEAQRQNLLSDQPEPEIPGWLSVLISAVTRKK